MVDELQRGKPMRPRPSPSACHILVLLVAAALAGCHESELEPKSPEQVWDLETPGASAEAAYTMAPVPAVFDPAPVPRDRPRSVSLGFIGDGPLTPSPHVGPHWPWVQEPFRYQGRGGFGSYGYHYRGGTMSSYAAPRHRR